MNRQFANIFSSLPVASSWSDLGLSRNGRLNPPKGHYNMFFWVLDGLEALRWTTFNFIWLALKSSASMDKFLDKASTATRGLAMSWRLVHNMSLCKIRLHHTCRLSFIIGTHPNIGLPNKIMKNTIKFSQTIWGCLKMGNPQVTMVFNIRMT